MFLRRLLIATVAAWLAWLPANARAQAGERATTAEDLFRQALQLTRQGRFADACPKFAESHRLDPAFGALMNLAACYEKIGRTASAWQAYVDATDLARDKSQRARADTARKKASQLAPRLVRLELRLGAGVEPRGLEITRNGKPFDLALLGNAVPVDPGSYAIVASRQGAEPWRTSANAIEPGKTVVVELAGPIATPVAPPEPPVAPATPARSGPRLAPVTPATPAPAGPRLVPVTHDDALVPRHEPEATDARARGRRITAISLVAGGAALVATGGVFAWLSRSISDDYTHVAMGERFDPDRDHRAKTYEVSAFVLWGAGAAAIAGGATIYFLGRSHDRGVSVVPAPVRGGAAAQVVWRW